MRRLRRTLSFSTSLLSLLLFLAILLFWATSLVKPRVIWWSHSSPFPHYHVATIRDGRLLLAMDRETSLSPPAQAIQLSFEVIALDRQAIELQRQRISSLKEWKGTDAVQVLVESAKLEHQTAELARAESALKTQQARYGLPPELGLGWGVAEILATQQTPRVAGVYVDPPSFADGLLQHLDPLPSDLKTQFAGLSLTRTSYPHGHRRIFSVPLWFLLLLLLILPALSLISFWKSRRRRNRGLCPICGYDLRASPDRCPECGVERQLTSQPVV